MSDMQFTKMRNGYNTYQVDEKLAELEEELRVLKHRLALFEKDNADLITQVALEKSRRIQLEDSYEANQQSIHAKKRKALSEANVIVDNANKNADLIIQEALESARHIVVEVERLSNEMQQVKGSISQQLADFNVVLEKLEPLSTNTLFKKINT